MKIEHFQRLYASNPDPWNVASSWYEQRKRSILLACLPKSHYSQAYEPACGNGELSTALAQRCRHLLATDGAQSAVRLAKERLHREIAAGQVTVLQQQIPYEWPETSAGLFDLVLVSEIAYYLDADALAVLVKRSIDCLVDGGTLLLCHWRHPFDDRVQATSDVHAAFNVPEYLHTFLHHDEKDFVIDVWTKAASPSHPKRGIP